jgi:intracellular sulfur oxidation DsrE/DsrF family protein
MKKLIGRCLLAVAVGVAMSSTSAFAQGDGPMMAPAGYYTVQKVVYQNDGGMPDPGAYFERLLRNIGNHIQAVGGKVEIRVVDFGDGVKPFVTAKTDAALAAKIDALKAKGVKFLICHNTLEGMKLKPSDLYGVTAEDVVPSGVAELARLQGQGFVYIHP